MIPSWIVHRRGYPLVRLVPPVVVLRKDNIMLPIVNMIVSS